MSDYGMLSLTSEDLKKEVNRLKNIVDGKAPGVGSKMISKDLLSSIPPLSSFVSKGEPEKQTYQSVANTTLERSLCRDVPYSMVGRRYLFTNGINRKIASIKNKMFLKDIYL